MPKIDADQPLIPSLLDRLLDDDPSLTRETAKSRTQVFREMKQSLRRDLENLLNTRWRYRGWPESLEELDLSLAGYGIPDITGADLRSSEDRERFRGIIEETIRRFEPRFKSVSVEMRDPAEPFDRTLRFRIDAMMYAEPAPEPVAFDSALQPATGTFEVKGSSR
jgi:type VI secretion system protein ImpF